MSRKRKIPDEPVCRKPSKIFTIPADSSLAEKTIYVLHTTKSTDKNVLTNILGEGELTQLFTVCLTETPLRYRRHEHSAAWRTNVPGRGESNSELSEDEGRFQIRMESREAAETAKEDGDNFDYDDGRQKSTLRFQRLDEQRTHLYAFQSLHMRRVYGMAIDTFENACDRPYTKSTYSTSSHSSTAGYQYGSDRRSPQM